jgi:hypothetical protein
MSDLAPINPPPADDGFGDMAREAEGLMIRGLLLKFADWRWTIGKENVPLKQGTQLIAIGAARAWVRWEESKPVEHQVPRAGEMMPEREELGDMNKGLWECDQRGDPKDPWQNTRYVYLVDPLTAELYTYATSSGGGRSAAIMLSDQIARMRTVHQSAVPVIEFGAAEMKTQYGRKSRPVLKVVGWRKMDQQIQTIAEPEQLALPSARQELDDDIPF